MEEGGGYETQVSQHHQDQPLLHQHLPGVAGTWATCGDSMSGIWGIIGGSAERGNPSSERRDGDQVLNPLPGALGSLLCLLQGLIQKRAFGVGKAHGGWFLLALMVTSSRARI